MYAGLKTPRGREPSIWTLCLGFAGRRLAEKVLLSYVSVLGINHVDSYGGHFTKWPPFPQVMLFISTTKRDVTTILIYNCKVAELRKTTAIRTKSVCTPCWGAGLKIEDLSLRFILLFRTVDM